MRRHSTFISTGLKQSEFDRCLYFLHTETSCLMFLVFVDDIWSRILIAMKLSSNKLCKVFSTSTACDKLT